MSLIDELRGSPPRSWLFVPALRAREWIPKALAAGADAVIVDLEDATAPDEKERARELVGSLDLGGYGDAPIFVRVNAAPPELRDADLEAAIASGAAGIVLPKVSGAEEIAQIVGDRLQPRGPGLALLFMLETARGVLRALEIAESDPALVGLAFGGEDLSAELGVSRTREPGELATARSLVALAAAAAGVAAIDTPWLDLADAEGAGREARAARQLGFSGKLVIHPSHVPAVNAAFTPDERESERARRIIEAFDAAVAQGTGIAKVDGRMIDRPVVVAARRVLAQAERGRRT